MALTLKEKITKLVHLVPNPDPDDPNKMDEVDFIINSLDAETKASVRTQVEAALDIALLLYYDNIEAAIREKAADLPVDNELRLAIEGVI